jgi:hypothetical protein
VRKGVRVVEILFGGAKDPFMLSARFRRLLEICGDVIAPLYCGELIAPEFPVELRPGKDIGLW